MNTTTTAYTEAAVERQSKRRDLLDVLSDERRRAIVMELAVGHSPMDDSDLVLAVADRIHERDVDDRTLRDVHVTCHHVHLPMLDDAGVLEWDRNAKTVARSDRFERAASLLEAILEEY